jgi:hypothetical protein
MTGRGWRDRQADAMGRGWRDRQADVTGQLAGADPGITMNCVVA